jgi:hypothetical protein
MFCLICTPGLVLTNSVSDLALKPMESMLKMVREIARTVFKSAELNEDLEQDEDSDADAEDLDQTSEMVLLEKVGNCR